MPKIPSPGATVINALKAGFPILQLPERLQQLSDMFIRDPQTGRFFPRSIYYTLPETMKKPDETVEQWKKRLSSPETIQKLAPMMMLTTAPVSKSQIPLKKDEVIMYHRTTPENAQKIMKSGKFYSKENTNELFLSNKQTGQTEGYGKAIVPVKVKKSDLRLDDEFLSGEKHYAVRVNKAVPISQPKVAQYPKTPITGKKAIYYNEPVYPSDLTNINAPKPNINFKVGRMQPESPIPYAGHNPQIVATVNRMKQAGFNGLNEAEKKLILNTKQETIQEILGGFPPGGRLAQDTALYNSGVPMSNLKFQGGGKIAPVAGAAILPLSAKKQKTSENPSGKSRRTKTYGLQSPIPDKNELGGFGQALQNILQLLSSQSQNIVPFSRYRGTLKSPIPESPSPGMIRSGQPDQQSFMQRTMGAVRNLPQQVSTSANQYMELIKKHFPQQEWENAYRVMMGESGGNPKAVGDNYPIRGEVRPSYGLFQIRTFPNRPAPEKLVDPETNVKYAAELWKSQKWAPWTVARNLGLVKQPTPTVTSTTQPTKFPTPSLARRRF